MAGPIVPAPYSRLKQLAAAAAPHDPPVPWLMHLSHLLLTPICLFCRYAWSSMASTRSR